MGQEDCLYLDVSVPDEEHRTDKGPLPVWLWIFGGGYEIGDAWEFGVYDGRTRAVKEQVVVVSFNYRLGALSSLSLPGLRDAGSGLGNLMLHDQRLAMEWVQTNIASFGGDPSRVTLAGESAGAFSVYAHLVSPLTRDGLFHGAVLEVCFAGPPGLGGAAADTLITLGYF